MNIDSFWIKNNYIKFNKTFFNNKYPNPDMMIFKTTDSHTVEAACKLLHTYKQRKQNIIAKLLSYNKHNDTYIAAIELSIVFYKSEKYFKELLLLQMINLFIQYNKLAKKYSTEYFKLFENIKQNIMNISHFNLMHNTKHIINNTLITYPDLNHIPNKYYNKPNLKKFIPYFNKDGTY